MWKSGTSLAMLSDGFTSTYILIIKMLWIWANKGLALCFPLKGKYFPRQNLVVTTSVLVMTLYSLTTTSSENLVQSH